MVPRRNGHTEISQGLDLFCDAQALVVVDAWLLRLLVISVVVVLFPQVTLERDQNKLDTWAVFGDFADPFCLYVLKRIGGVDLACVSSSRKNTGLSVCTEKQSMMACVSS